MRGQILIFVLLTGLLTRCDQNDHPIAIDWVLVEGGEFDMGMDEPLISPRVIRSTATQSLAIRFG